MRKGHDWRDVRLGDVVTFINGDRGRNYPTQNDYRTDGVPFVSAKDLADGRLELSNVTRISGEAYARLSNGKAHDGDIFFCLRGSLGKMARFEGTDKAAIASSLVIIRATNRIDREFLYYLLAGPVGQRLATALDNGSAQPNISVRALQELCIPAPPLEQQQVIGDLLKTLDDKIEQNRRTGRALERLMWAIFGAWFVDFEPVKAKAAGATSFPSMPQQVFDVLPTHFVDSEIGSVPEGWEVRAIGDVVTVKGGGTPSTKNAEYWDGEHCWATPKDMSRLSHPVLLDTERRITDVGVNVVSSGILPVGTVLMSSRAPVGYLAITGVPTSINQGFIAMVCDGPLPPTYILNWALTSMDAIKAHASGTTFPEISKKTFRPLPVVQPTDDVIAAYQQTTDPLFDLLVACVKENDRLAEMRDYLLPRLLSGSVRVRS